MKESIEEDFDNNDIDEIEESEIDKIIEYLKQIQGKKPKQDQQNYTKVINILLLGQTGCGKSTFINSFQNYMNHNDLYRLCVLKKIFFVVIINFKSLG